jgi:hypothetical protein
MVNPYRFLPALLLAVGAATVSACATPIYQTRGVYAQQFERRAYDNGYREGLTRGREDARSRRQFSYDRHNEYRNADDGYRRQDGYRDDYRRSFRQGFETGYTQAYNQFARVDNRAIPRGTVRPGVYLSVAADTGYRDGIDAGRKDARNRDRFAPERASRYRSADHNYDRRFGSKDEFRREYRAAFERGYRDGFTGARS